MKHRLNALWMALAVLLCSAVLAAVNHNAQPWYTGQWDEASQELVYGRMLQMQQKQRAPGGFLGVYTEAWEDVQNKYAYRENTPQRPEDYHSYTHQPGLQGTVFAVLNKILSVWQPAGEHREQTLYMANATLYYAVTLSLCLAVWRALGLLPAAAWLGAALLAPAVQCGMKNLYWCLWLWWAPMLAGVALCVVCRRRGKLPPWALALPFAASLLRCLCGFEYISTYLMLSELPLVFCWAQDLCQKRSALPWLGRMAAAGAAGLAGFAVAMGIWLVQQRLYYGSWAQSFAGMAEAVTGRLSVTDAAVHPTSVGAVLLHYLTDPAPVLRLGPLGVTVRGLLAAVGAAFVLTALLLAWLDRTALRQMPPLLCAWAVGAAAPLSWMVLSKAHAELHPHLTPMLWHFALVPASCTALAACTVWCVRSVRAALRRSKVKPPAMAAAP